MSRPRLGRRDGWALIVVVLAVAGWLATAAPASADPLVWAFPDTPSQPGAGGSSLPCLPTDPFCAIGQVAGAAITNVWITAMLALWQAGLWLLGLAFSVTLVITFTVALTEDFSLPTLTV